MNRFGARAAARVRQMARWAWFCRRWFNRVL